MIFTNPRTIANGTIPIQTITWINKYNKPASKTVNTPIPQPSPVKSITEVADPPDPTKKKMKWGEPVWFFFHTIAEKIKPDVFPVIRMELLKIINNICRNLPCPLCAQHAGQYLDKTNLNTIQTKEQLIEFLYTFHNEVNKRKGFAIFPRELLREKYAQANTVNIIRYFLTSFLDKSYSIRMIADDFHRKRLVDELGKWLSSNMQHFNL